MRHFYDWRIIYSKFFFLDNPTLFTGKIREKPRNPKRLDFSKFSTNVLAVKGFVKDERRGAFKGWMSPSLRGE
jgi:hypothetical protein